jgi:hypothetical protein
LKVVTGTEKLSIIIDNIKKPFLTDFIYSKNMKFNLKNKITPEFINVLTEKPLIFYAKKGSFNASYDGAEFVSFAPFIYYAENLETLRYLKVIDVDIQNEIEIQWVIIETEKNIKMSAWLDKLIFLDFWQKEKGKKDSSGKIDYFEIENLLKELSPKNYGQMLVKKFIKYVTYPLLKIKPPQDQYIFPTLRYIKTPLNIKITEDMNNYVYRYKCPICGNKYSVVLSNSKNKRKLNVKKMIVYNSKEDKIEFKCDHEGTIYEGKNRPYFRPSKVGGFSLKEDIDYDKAFLYLFERYKKEGDNFILIKENGELKSNSISDYINDK